MSQIADTKHLTKSPISWSLSLALIFLFSSTAKANPWQYDIIHNGIDSFTSDQATTLMKVELSASTDVWNNNSFNINASYTGISYDQDHQSLGYNEVSRNFNISAPAIHAMDFRDSIRERSEICLEKIIDNMIVDGAVGFNVSW